MMIVSASSVPSHGLAARPHRFRQSSRADDLSGIGATSHDVRRRGRRSLYGASHDVPRKGKGSLYGVAGPWGDFGRDILGDIVGTGIDLVRDRNDGDGGGGDAAPIVVVQDRGPSIPWVPILTVAALGVGAWILLRNRRR